MDRVRRHRALRCWFVAHHLGMRVADVMGWSDEQISRALLSVLGGRC